MPDDIVRDVYTRFPYPPWEPSGGTQDGIARITSLPLICSTLWGGDGRRVRNGLRILDAGCGTGDAAVSLARQLRGTGSEVIGLDFSSSAIEKARKRSELALVGDGLSFVQGSILDAGELAGGKFDFILCKSVLPHLDSPEEGLRALAGLLKADGGMGIKVYARYGREPIGIFQQLCSMANPPSESLEKRVAGARELLGVLPPNHQVRGMAGYRELAYDSVLPGRTRPFSVPELYAFLAQAGMKMARFVDGIQYRPSFYTKGKFPGLDSLPLPEQQAAAELLSSRIQFHQFFATREGFSPPSLAQSDESLVPLYTVAPPDIREEGTVEFNSRQEEFILRMKIPKEHAGAFALVDGLRSTGGIIGEFARDRGLAPEDVRRSWQRVSSMAIDAGMMCLSLP